MDGLAAPVQYLLQLLWTFTALLGQRLRVSPIRRTCASKGGNNNEKLRDFGYQRFGFVGMRYL